MTHMQWCKQRALEYLDAGDVTDAIASFASDIRKDESTDNPTIRLLVATIGIPLAMAGDSTGLCKFIRDFNG